MRSCNGVLTRPSPSNVLEIEELHGRRTVRVTARLKGMRLLTILMLLLAGCSKGLPGNAPSGPPRRDALVPVTEVHKPKSDTPTELKKPQAEPAAPAGVGPLIATVVSGDQAGALTVKFETLDVCWLADSRLALFRTDQFIATFVVAWGSRDDEANLDVLMCHALSHDDFEILDGDKFYLLGGTAGRGGRASAGGMNMPFGESMFGPWHVGGVPFDP
jgi:hypothetical protein